MRRKHKPSQQHQSRKENQPNQQHQPSQQHQPNQPNQQHQSAKPAAPATAAPVTDGSSPKAASREQVAVANMQSLETFMDEFLVRVDNKFDSLRALK
jgi:hypothetical protein